MHQHTHHDKKAKAPSGHTHRRPQTLPMTPGALQRKALGEAIQKKNAAMVERYLPGGIPSRIPTVQLQTDSLNARELGALAYDESGWGDENMRSRGQISPLAGLNSLSDGPPEYYREFMHYVDLKLATFPPEDEKAKNKFSSKVEKFLTKMKRGEEDNRAETGWGAMDYNEALGSEGDFQDYDTVIGGEFDAEGDREKEEIADWIRKLTEANSKVQGMIDGAGKDAQLDQVLLREAREKLIEIEERKGKVTARLTGYPASRLDPMIAILKGITDNFEATIAKIEANIGKLGDEGKKLAPVPPKLTEILRKLEEFNNYIKNSSSLPRGTVLAELEKLKREFDKLTNEAKMGLEDADGKERENVPLDKEVYSNQFEAYSSRMSEAETKTAEAVKAQETETRLPEISEEQINMLTAVSLAEGAGLGDEYWDIVFVYINLIQAFGFEMGMRRSSTYPHYGEITASDREKENYDQNKLESIGSFKGWMVALGAGEKYRAAGDLISPRSTKTASTYGDHVRKVLKAVIAKPQSNPFPTFQNQAYIGDLDKPSVGDFFGCARAWLWAKVTGKIDLKTFRTYMEIIGSGLETTVLWNEQYVTSYVNANPEFKKNLPAQIMLVGNDAVMIDPTTKTQYKLIKTREHEVPK